MNLEPRWKALGLWSLAGVPVVMTFLQAGFAITGVEPSAVPLVGSVVAAMKSVAVLAAASTVFEQNPTVVPLLFVLVTLAWLVEGGTMFGLRAQTLSYGAAGFVTLFLVLFLLAYLPLFEASVPVVQLAGFVLVAVVAAGASWGAVSLYDWDPDLEAETERHLATARERVRSARQEFEEEIERRVDEGTRDRLRPVAPDAVESAEERIEAFREECDRILDRADGIAGDAELSAREREREAETLATEAGALDPAERVDGVAEALTARLPDAIRREFADVHVVSRYGSAYEVRNHVDSNAVRLPGIETTAQVGGDPHDLDERLADAVGEYPLSAVGSAVADARDHVDSLESHLRDQEESFDARVQDARDRLAIVEDEIEAIEGRPADRLRELLLEGRYESDPPPGPSAPDVEAAIERGTDCLHDCDFDAAEEHATEAAETAERLVAIAEFFRAVAETIADEGRSVPVPAAASEDLARAMASTFERETGVSYDVADGRVRFSYGAASEARSVRSTSPLGESGGIAADPEPDDTPTAESSDPTGRSRSPESVDPATVVDEAVYVLNELERAAEDSVTVGTVEIQTDELPSQCTEPGVLETVVDFGRRQHGVASFEVQPDAPPGYLSLSVSDDESPAAVVDRIREQYLTNYRNG